MLRVARLIMGDRLKFLNVLNLLNVSGDTRGYVISVLSYHRPVIIA